MPWRRFLPELRAAVRGGGNDLCLRAYLTNMLCGLRHAHVDPQICRGILDKAALEFDRLLDADTRHPGMVLSTLMGAMRFAMPANTDAGFFDRIGGTDVCLDLPAVTFQQLSDGGKRLDDWLEYSGPPQERRLATVDDLSAVFTGDDTFRMKGSAKVGNPAGALWLAPLDGEINDLLLGRGGYRGGTRHGTGAERAKRAIDLVGILGDGRTLVALVTKKKLGELTFDWRGRAFPTPRGPTVIEAQEHFCFRHWPCPGYAGGDHPIHGRTYDLDTQGRTQALAFRQYGVKEFCCPQMALTDFGRCHVLGAPPALTTMTSPDETFLDDIGAAGASCDLLEDLLEELAL